MTNPSQQPLEPNDMKCEYCNKYCGIGVPFCDAMRAKLQLRADELRPYAQQPSEVEDQEIEHLVAQYGKDPRRFIGTIQGETLTIDEALLKYRTTVIAIHEGKSNGVDIETANNELLQLITRYGLEQRNRENESVLYWLEDTELPAEMIVTGLTKDRKARRKQLQALTNQEGTK